MVSQKLVRLSALVLALAVMAINAKMDDREGKRPSREQMALGILCR